MKTLPLIQRGALAGCVAAMALGGTAQAKAVVINFGTISSVTDISLSHFLKADKKIVFKFKITGPLTYDFAATEFGSQIISDSGGDGKYKFAFGPAASKGTVYYTLKTSAVAEPATWAFMILGFGAVGGLARRRNRIAPSARAYA
jgi:hypothetical protein